MRKFSEEKFSDFFEQITKSEEKLNFIQQLPTSPLEVRRQQCGDWQA
jgi:hypothetical protein